MLTVQAVKEIKTNEVITGYTLKDVNTGKEMDIPVANIIKVMKSGQASFLNLELDQNNQLVIKNKEQENTVKNDIERVFK